MNTDYSNGKKVSLVSFIVLLVVVSAFFFQGCASSKSASYHHAQKQIEHGDISFHKTIRVDEYLNAFPHDWLQIPEGESIIVRVDPFSSYQPEEADRTLFQIAVRTRKATEAEMQEPVGVCFVLDKSGSMEQEGSILDMVEAVVHAVMEMKNGDEIAVIVFDNKAGVYVSPQVINEKSRLMIAEKLRMLTAGGGTNIEAGLVLGYKSMSEFTIQGPKRLLLITDGNSNVGVTSPMELARKAKVEYLEGARISTIGLSYYVDEKLLRRIAQEGSGHYYFAESGKYLKSLLAKDMRSTIQPVARNVRLTVSAGDGFKIMKVYGAEKVTLMENALSTDIGEMNINDWRILIAEVEGSMPPGEYRPLSAQLNYILTGTEASSSMHDDALVAWHTGTEKSNSTVNQHVARNSVLFGNAATLIKVGELSSQGDYRNAVDIVNIQIQNNRLIRNDDNADSINKEIESLSNVKKIIENKIGLSQPKAKTAEHAYSEDKSSQIKGIIVEGVAASTDNLPGIWSTVGKLLILLVI